MDKYKIIALFGKSGAGKDTIQKWLINNIDMNSIISCTTRPPRDYEQNGIDYHFISIDEFTKKILDYSMLEATSFNDWFYGTPIESLSFDKINIGVFNIEGINSLMQNPQLHILPIHIVANDKVRLLRILQREKNPDCYEICRRFLTDEKDFSDIDFPYFEFNNNNATINDVINFFKHYENTFFGHD